MKFAIKPIVCSIFALHSTLALAVDLGVYVSVDTNLVTTSKTQAQWLASVDQMMLEANELYDESNVDIELVSAHVDFRDMTYSSGSGLLNEIRYQQNEFANILTQADRYGADYIIALTDLDALNLCGQAVAVNKTQTAIASTGLSMAISDPDCGEDTFVHELGHLMGLAHGDQVSTARNNSAHSNALTPYAKGWGHIVDLESANNTYTDESREAGEYATLMVGNHVVYWTGNTWNVKVPLFSSPNTFNTTCGTQACGDAANGDATRALNEHRYIYASHEEVDADHLSYADANLANCLSYGYSDTEVVDLNSLSCSGNSIKGVKGIEQLSSLNNIDLSNNNIINLSALQKMSASIVQSINLEGNNYALCHQLEQLNEQFAGGVAMPDSCFNAAAHLAYTSLIY